MKIIHSGIAAAMALSTFAQPLMASEATDKATLRRIYATIDAAANRGEVAKVGSHLTSDFRSRAFSGRTTNKKQSLQVLATLVKGMKMKFLPTTIYTMRVTGNRAVIEASGGATQRRRDPQGKTHTLLILSSTRDQWVKVGGVWKQRLSETFAQEVRVDGRVVSQQ